MSDTKWISAGFRKYSEKSIVEEDEDTMLFWNTGSKHLVVQCHIPEEWNPQLGLYSKLKTREENEFVDLTHFL